MKHSIEEIKNNRVIKTVKLIENGTIKAIEIIYLDGKKDIIEFRPEVMENILKTMTEQAEEFVKDKESKQKKLKEKRVFNFVFWAILQIFGIIVVASNFTLLPIMIGIGAMVFSTVLEQINLSKIESKIEDLDKYDLYLKDFQEQVETYVKISEKEKSLGAKISRSVQKKCNLKSIVNLDDYTLDDLKGIAEKVSRYTTFVSIDEFSDSRDEPGEKIETGYSKVKKR